MRKLLAATAIGGALLGATLGTGTAQASETFLSCGYGAGIASSVTSCAFAHNVRYAWFHQPGQVVEAYSPVTGQYYDMQCAPGFSAWFDNGAVRDSVRCVGGNNAVVVIW